MARSPLFDIYDPYGTLQQQAEMGLLPYDEDIEPLGVMPLGKRKATLSDLMPEEEKAGLLNTLSSITSTGLAGAGWLIDTPGSIIRGALSGGIGKGISALWENSDDRVTGRELLRQYDLIGDKDTWSNFFAGLAAETVLDPTFYFAPWSILGKTGGLSRTGRAMERSGAFRNLAEDAAEYGATMRTARGVAGNAPVGTREYVRGLTPRSWFQTIPDRAERAEAMLRYRDQANRLGIAPGNRLDSSAGALWDFSIPGTNIGTSVTGGAAGDAAARLLDRAGQSLRNTAGIGQAVRGLDAIFDSRAGGLGTVGNDLELSGDVQLANRRAANAARDAEADFLREMADVEYGVRQLPPEMPLPAGAYGPAVPLPRFEDSRLWQSAADYVESRALPAGGMGPMLPRTSGNAYYDMLFESVPEYRRVIDTFDDIGIESAGQAVARGLADPTWTSRAADTGWIARQLKRFVTDRPPEIPGGGGRAYLPYSSGERLLATSDNFGRGRRSYTDIPFPQRTARSLSGTTTGEFDRLVSGGQAQNAIDSRALQQALIRATPDQSINIMERAFATAGTPQPYQYIVDDVLNSPNYASATAAEQAAMLTRAQEQVRQNYLDYADLLRTADTQLAGTGTGLYDTNAWTNMVRYGRGQARVQANADELIEQLVRRSDPVAANSVAGAVNIPLVDAARQFGFDEDNFRRMWQQRTGSDVTNFSVNERLIQALGTLAPKTKLDEVSRGIVRAADNVTNMFKVGALAYPGFHTRNLYSGLVNARTHSALNLGDLWAAFRASGGDAEALGRRLRNTPGYNLPQMTDADRARQFLTEAAAQKVSQSQLDDIVSGLPEQRVTSLVPGSQNPGSVSRTFYNPDRTWGGFAGDFFGMRGVGVTSNPLPENTNPLLALNDSVGKRVEDTLRLQTFLNQVRKGIDPGVAGDVTRMVNVDYSPQAFSAIERDFLKRAVPFYSYQKGILPSIAKNMIDRPGGVQSQLIRAVNRASEPSEDNFTPPYLRQSSAIPLPPEWGNGNPQLQRYLTSIDLPWESTLNLLTPGTGGTTAAAITNTIQETGSNLLGQLNPLLKAPLEYVTNRQLYSGRDLSDAYSVLERDLGQLGRPLEQIVSNFVPFGSRALGLYRTATDDRLSVGDKSAKAAFNLLAGAKIRDVDMERTKQLAARDVLNQILETTPGVRTYENITVPEDVVAAMPKEQRDLYLLYKIIQSEAAKRARDKKRQETALDPLQVLGVLQ